MLDIQDPVEARKVIRENKYTEQTAGSANKYVQGNLCILPSKYAMDFASFCQKNPKPCPLIGFGTKGDPSLKNLGDIDIRTDVPQYRVWEKGKLVDEPYDIKKYWNQDLTTFVLGCSMSFELPLIEAGIPIQHIENNTIRSIQISSRFPAVHGAPIHLGSPDEIGIKDIMKPEYGDPPRAINNDEIPVFWACGVTPQSVLESSKPDFCITHSPGKMLITDKLNNDLAAF